MADTVNLFGSQVKKGYVIAGGLVVVVAAGYGWYKNKKSGAAAPANAAAPAVASTAPATAGDPYPPDGTSGNPGDPNSTDPASGQTYGDEAGGFASGYGYGSGAGYDYYGAGGSYYPPGVNGGTPTYTTNGQWAQAAEQYLVNTVGANATTIAAALGKYVTGQPVTSDQAAVIEQAIAFVGYPPQNGPEGYPPNIQTQASSSPPPGGGGGTGGTSAPKSAPGGLSVTGHSKYADFGWGVVSGASKYELAAAGAGGKGAGTSHVDQVSAGNHAERVAMTPGRYTARVRAGNSAGWGPWTAARAFTVSK